MAHGLTDRNTGMRNRIGQRLPAFAAHASGAPLPGTGPVLKEIKSFFMRAMTQPI
jgi:hypothetical protein